MRLRAFEIRANAWKDVSAKYADHEDAWYRGYAAAMDAAATEVLHLVSETEEVASKALVAHALFVAFAYGGEYR